MKIKFLSPHRFLCDLRGFRKEVKAERGIALMLVLWVLTLLSIMVFEFCYTMRIEATITKNFKEGVRSYYLAQAGINPERMGAIGFGEFRPTADNLTVENRQKNRRVVIRVLAGEDMFSDATPFADTEVKASQQLEQPVSAVSSLQAAEPARDLQ